MNREEVIRMAKKSGVVPRLVSPSGEWFEHVERFSALVAAAERERCAKECDKQRNYFGYQIASAIRALT